VFEAADIREWRGHHVVDDEGHKIGELEAVYVDTGTDLPSFATVKVGLPTRRRLVFVPLDGATVGPGYLKVSFDKKLVKDAPSIGTDGELPVADEEAVFNHYGLTYQAAAAGVRRLARPGGAPRAGDQMFAHLQMGVIAAIVLGIVGVVAKGLLYLLIIGIVVFIAALTMAALRMRRRPGRRQAR
jgi:hypothetical protein